MATVIWVDSDTDDDDIIEIVETPTPRKPLAGPSSIVNTPGRRDNKKRQRDRSLDSDIIVVTPRPVKIHKAGKQPQDGDKDDDHAIALALQKKWEEEDALAQKHAAETEEKSIRLIARLQEMDQKVAEKRQKLAKREDVPDDGIVFRVKIDAEGKTIEGDDDPDNAAHLDIVKRDFEQALANGLKVKTVEWFVNAKLEARFEAAKELLNSLGIDATEKNLFHGTAATNIQPILQNGFLIPGVSPGVQMAHGAACGVGIYLATSPATSMGYTMGASRMFMCRVITGRSTNLVCQQRPQPLGRNGFESWSGPGVYVVKYVDLVVPRYVVEFEMNAALQNYGIAALLLAPPAVPVPAVAPPVPAMLGGMGVFGVPPAPVAGPAVAVPPASRRKRAPAKRTAKLEGKGKAKAELE